MSLLSAFTDLLLATKPKAISSPEDIVNQATKYRTYLFPRMLKGLSRKEIVQNGTKIIDFVQLAIQSSYRDYNPTDSFNYTADNSLVQIEVPWRFSMVDSVTYKHEVELNSGDVQQVFKRISAAKNKVLEQSFWEGAEDSLWADPNYETMEAATIGAGVTGTPLSLRSFITADGGAPTSSNGGVASGSSAWTTVMQVSPTTYPNWKNQYETFDSTSAATRAADVGGVLDAFHSMWLDVQWQSPSTSEEYFKNTMLSKLVICCNKLSYRELVRLATTKNNVLTPVNDLGYQNGRVTYNGIPIMYIGKLDSVDTGGADGAYSGGYKSIQYRWINFNHIKPIFHSGNYRARIKKDGGASHPFAEVVIEDTWRNLWCANRREQGIVRAA